MKLKFFRIGTAIPFATIRLRVNSRAYRTFNYPEYAGQLINPYAGDDRGIVTVHRWSSGPAYRRSAASDRWGWRSWRHEVRAPHGRLVSIVPRLPRDERARSKFLRSRLFAVDSLPFPSSPFSLFSFSLFLTPFSFCRSHLQDRARGVRARAKPPPLRSGIVPRSRPRVWDFGDLGDQQPRIQDSISAIVTGRTRGLTPGTRSWYMLLYD